MFNINPSNDSYLLTLFESISPMNRAFPKSFSILHYTLNDTLCYDRMLLFSILASDGHLMVVLVFHFPILNDHHAWTQSSSYSHAEKLLKFRCAVCIWHKARLGKSY